MIRVLGVYADTVLLPCMRRKLCRSLVVLHEVAADNKIFLPGAEDLLERRDVKLLGCCDEGISGLRRGVESLWPGDRGSGCSRRGGRSRRLRGGLLRGIQTRYHHQQEQSPMDWCRGCFHRHPHLRAVAADVTQRVVIAFFSWRPRSITQPAGAVAVSA